MNLDFPEADSIDSTCDKRLPQDDLPEAVGPVCKEEAVTWVAQTDGTPLYLCEEHVLDLLRFADDSEERLRELDYHEELVPLASERGVNLTDGKDRETLVNRMAQRKDPADLPEHPRAKECPTCRRLTLRDEFDLVSGTCVGCSGEREELSLDRYRTENG